MFSALRLFVLLLATVCATGAERTVHARDLAGDIRQAVMRTKFDSSAIGFAVLDCHAEQILAASNANGLFIPASNMKVITTAAALDVLGPDFAFETRLLVTSVNGRTTLTLVGSGDPALFDPEAIRTDGSHGNWSTVGSAVDAWVASLRAAGIARIDEFVIDARIFDSEPIPAGDDKWLKNRDDGVYAVGVWGFNLAANAALVTTSWTAGARPAIAAVEPPLPFRVTTNTATCNAKLKGSFAVGFGKAPGQLTFSGNLQRAAQPLAVAIHQPLSLAGEMFATEFTRRGISVSGWRVAAPSDPAAVGAVVAPVLTTPLATVLRGANTDSNNLYAEALSKRMGAHRSNPVGAPIGPAYRPGSWASGHTATSEALTRRLVTDCKGRICLADGSGLSAENRVSPDLTVRLLASMARDNHVAAPYFASFARPREPGTLQRRFAKASIDGVQVYGKSGYIDEASCLSGIVIGPGGRAIAYSVLCNDLRGRVRDAKELQENVVEAIARELRGPSGGTRTATAGDGR
jgi:D-alanyl-D-alanine carboxypeptidase/D-alanyl-D-alanine-endopeptidase (penicillin-binding protein 4)